MIHPRARVLVTSASSLALLLAVRSEARAGCKTDMDCEGDALCDRGVCISPSGTVVSGEPPPVGPVPQPSLGPAPRSPATPVPAGPAPQLPPTPAAAAPAATTTSTSSGSASARGLNASFTSEKVTAVADPPSSVASFALDGGYMFGTSTKSGSDMQMHMGTLGLGVKVLTGAKLPGVDGGSWNGIAVEPQVQGLIGGLVMGDNGAFIGGLNAGGVVGWQYLHFGQMDPVTLKQGGFGIQLGARVGYQHTWFDMTTTYMMPVVRYSGSTPYITYYPQTTHVSSDSGSFSYGPNIQLTFPNYNAGTAHLSRGYVNFMLLPTGDFLMVSIMGGGAF